MYLFIQTFIHSFIPSFTHSFSPFHSSVGGALNVSFTSDLTHFFTSGCDGSLTCFKWALRKGASEMIGIDAAETAVLAELPPWRLDVERGLSRASKGGGGGGGVGGMVGEIEEEESVVKSGCSPSLRTPTPNITITPDTTWLEIKNMQILEEEERKFIGIKTELRQQIDKMRNKLHKLMAENDARMETERLGRLNQFKPITLSC